MGNLNKDECDAVWISPLDVAAWCVLSKGSGGPDEGGPGGQGEPGDQAGPARAGGPREVQADQRAEGCEDSPE